MIVWQERRISLSRGRLAALLGTIVVVTAVVTIAATVLVKPGTAASSGPPGIVVAPSDVQPVPWPTSSSPTASWPTKSPTTGSPSASPTGSAAASSSPSLLPTAPAPTTRTTPPLPPVGNARVPADILNLSAWKVTLPIGSGHDPQEITQPTLAHYAINPYFMVNAAHTGVVFQANAGGVTTSNSGYPRSELREMTAGGSEEASWSTTSGTNTMTVREAITHLTVVKPQVTVAQVHDGEDDVIVIRLDGPHHLYAEHNGTDYGDLDNNYVLGTAFTAQFVASGGHIRISYNGVQKVDYTKTSSGDYFKAGCYTQSNTSKGDAADAYAQVVIYALAVTHTK